MARGSLDDAFDKLQDDPASNPLADSVLRGWMDAVRIMEADGELSSNQAARLRDLSADRAAAFSIGYEFSLPVSIVDAIAEAA